MKIPSAENVFFRWIDYIAYNESARGFRMFQLANPDNMDAGENDYDPAEMITIFR